MPGVVSGRNVKESPADVQALYFEARRAASVGAYTASVMASRKILMHIAVDKGADPGDTFQAYVGHLADAGWVPPDGRRWVDHIRTRGNEANHEIHLMKRADAEELIRFVELLLRFVYEFGSHAPAVEDGEET